MLITLGALTIESIIRSHGKTQEKWSSSKGHPTWVSCSPHDSPPMIVVQGFVFVVCSKPCCFSPLNHLFNDNLTFQRSCQEGICDSYTMNIQQLQRFGILNEDSASRGRHLDDHTAATHVYNQGPGSRYDEFLQLVQEHQTVAEAEEPDDEYGLTKAMELVEPATEKARLKSKQVVRTVGLPEACRTMKFVAGLLTSMLIDGWLSS
ncbi:hypothetical protein ACFX2H_043084 [Malus domestica]